MIKVKKMAMILVLTTILCLGTVTAENYTVSKPPPPHQLNSTKVTNTSIDLHWSIPNYPNGSIANYVITYNGIQVNTTNTSTSFTLTGLVPLTVYTISIAARNEAGVGNSSKNITIQTSGVPRSPVNATAENKTCNSVSLSWQPPANNGGSSIEGYQIAIPEAPGGLEPVRTTSTTTVIIGLQPNTFYTIHIRAKNAFGLSLPAVVNTSTEKLHTVSKPPPPHQLNSTKVTNTSIDLHWSIPNYPNGSIINYVITYNGSRVNTTNASTSFTLTGLVPLTIYTISIAARNEAGVGNSSKNITIQTSGVPRSPVNATAENKTCNSVSLSWQPPANNGGSSIEDYHVTIPKAPGGFEPVQTTSTTTVLIGLQPSTVYTIHIRATNAFGLSLPAVVNISTEELRSGSLNVVPIGNDTSIELSHSLKDVYFTCKISGSGHRFNISGEGYIITGLKPDAEYRIECLTYLNGADYCSEANISVMTTPGKITNLAVNGKGKVVGSGIHQSISWERPPDHKSPLTYTIKYTTADGMEHETTSDTVFNLTFMINDIHHVVHVAAVSDAGQGVYEVITIQYTEPHAPEVIVVNKTCNSVLLRWSPPHDTGGLPIQDYAIFRNDSPESSTGPLLLTERTATVTHLNPGTLYTFTVTAKNVIGETKKSHLKPFSVTTDNRKSFELEFEAFSSTGAHLIIPKKPPSTKGSAIYSCTLSPSSERTAMRNISEHNVTFNNLKPGTSYSVTCLAYSDTGEELCYEGTANGRTFPSVSEISPVNVKVTERSSVHFTVEWDVPEKYKNNQDIQSYTVEYWEAGFVESKHTNTTFRKEFNVTGLDAGKVYSFQVKVNKDGMESGQLKVVTIPKVQNIIISKISNTSALVQWNRTSIEYIIWFDLSVNDIYSFGIRSFAPVDLRNLTEHKIDNLSPFRSYTFNMYLQLGKHGNGSSVQNTFKTLGTEPTESPTNLSVVSDKRNATLYWGVPPISGRNGIITSYTIQWMSPGLQTSPIHLTVHQPNFTHPERMSSTLKGLRPYTAYKWKVAAVNINGSGPFSPWNDFKTAQDIPGSVETLTITPTNASSLMVTWKEPSTPNGIIIAYSICYWTLGDTCRQPMNVSNPGKTEENIHGLDPGTPYKVGVTAFTSAGEGEDNIHDDIIFTEELPPNRTVFGLHVNWTNPSTVKISWTPLTVHEARGIPTYRINITSEGRAIRLEDTIDSYLIVGGLDQTKWYSVSVQPFTKFSGEILSGEASEPVNFGSPLTQPPHPMGSIVIIIVLLVIIILICLVFLVITVVVCKYKRSQKQVYKIDEELSLKQLVAVVDDNTIAHNNMKRKDPIQRHLFSEHVREMHCDKDDGFQNEFRDITKEPPVSNQASERNVPKNRYINIYPYDYSRVLLTNSDGSDYVNAAFLDGYKAPKRYIATQGPILTTTKDFWEMIWEQKTTVIVMLTRLVEGTKVKCEQYWNEELNEPYEPGRNLKVTMTSNKVMTGFEVRQFRVEKTSAKSDPIKVKHFLYTAWPDHGVPQYTSSMVKFILHHYKPEVKDSTAPIVVHCSAGAGRTGTFVAIDTTIDRLAEEDDINIFECVELMRTKRTQMVQNVSQYIYIHDAINDYVTCGETAIVAHELGQKILEMNKTDPTTYKTGFEQLFKLLQETSATVCDEDQEFSLRPDIAERNRYKTHYPYSDNFITTEDDEEYINATEIKGYYGQSTFIAGQAPMNNTIENTWNAITQQNCSVVVVLNNFEEHNQEMCAEFWPGEVGIPMEFEDMTISLISTVHKEQFDEYKLSISVEDADIPNEVDVYHYKAWIKHSSPDVPSLLKLMGDVENSLQGSSGPLMVMCDDGMSRTGVFITVMSEIDRVKMEGEIDIFQTVKAVRTARPHMVPTVGDYKCCHEILQQYLESFDTYANFK